VSDHVNGVLSRGRGKGKGDPLPVARRMQVLEVEEYATEAVPEGEEQDGQQQATDIACCSSTWRSPLRSSCCFWTFGRKLLMKDSVMGSLIASKGDPLWPPLDSCTSSGGSGSLSVDAAAEKLAPADVGAAPLSLGGAALLTGPAGAALLGPIASEWVAPNWLLYGP